MKYFVDLYKVRHDCRQRDTDNCYILTYDEQSKGIELVAMPIGATPKCVDNDNKRFSDFWRKFKVVTHATDNMLELAFTEDFDIYLYGKVSDNWLILICSNTVYLENSRNGIYVFNATNNVITSKYKNVKCLHIYSEYIPYFLTKDFNLLAFILNCVCENLGTEVIKGVE